MRIEDIKVGEHYRLTKNPHCYVVNDDDWENHTIVVTKIGRQTFEYEGWYKDICRGTCCGCVKASMLEPTKNDYGWIVYTPEDWQFDDVRGKLNADSWRYDKEKTAVRIDENHVARARESIGFYASRREEFQGIHVTYEEYVAIRGSKKTIVNNLTDKCMNIIDKVKFELKSEPEKSLIKAGIMNSDESLTSDGRAILEMILIENLKEELKVKADIILASEEKAKK